jgi:capsule biosynthesis phosphatase
MRICIDLDGVICELRGNNQGYSNLKPVEGAIEKIKALKNEGHYVIIYTARRMKTHKSNKGKILADVGKTTLDWLAKYEVPYDEIYFGKPWADIYIDDNAFRFLDWNDISDDGSSLPCSKEKVFRGKDV